MLSEFENKLAGFIKANGLFEQAGKILLARSPAEPTPPRLCIQCRH
jgi:hypothetical protein